MTSFNLGGATFQSGLNVPGFGKASGSRGLKIPKLGSVSSNINIDLSKGVNGLTGDIKLTKDKGNVFRSGATDSAEANDISHQAVCSYFIGPQAENMKYFRKNMDGILDQLEQSRVNYFPEDGVSVIHPQPFEHSTTLLTKSSSRQAFITEQIQNSAEFQDRTTAVAKAIQKTGELLGKHSIPFWSPRYQAHMCMDMSMPALLGYFTSVYRSFSVEIFHAASQAADVY